MTKREKQKFQTAFLKLVQQFCKDEIDFDSFMVLLHSLMDSYRKEKNNGNEKKII